MEEFEVLDCVNISLRDHSEQVICQSSSLSNLNLRIGCLEETCVVESHIELVNDACLGDQCWILNKELQL